MQGSLEYCFYSEDHVPTQDLLEHAIERFGELYCGTPDVLIIDLWRRLTTLSASAWNTASYGPLRIAVASPCDAPAAFARANIAENTVLAIRHVAHFEEPRLWIEDGLVVSSGDFHADL